MCHKMVLFESHYDVSSQMIISDVDSLKRELIWFVIWALQKIT
jgi:hypothetical protein